MDSIFEKWNELPPLMRYECVKWMDFTTRMRLRQVSKSEKSLVESAPKYKLGSAIIDWDACTHMPVARCFNLSDRNNPEFLVGTSSRDDSRIFDEKGGKLSLHVLKFADIENVKLIGLLDNPDDVEKLLSEISNHVPFRFKNFQLDIDNWKVAEFFLKNCKNLESLEIANYGGCPFKFPLEKLIGIPSVVKAKTLFLKIAQSIDGAGKLIKKWIVSDIEIGTKFQGGITDLGIIEVFGKQFKNRLISKRPDELRIKTDNSAKHILIRKIHVPHASVAFVSFHVIPANLKESEYEKNDEWVNVIMYEQEAMMVNHFNDMMRSANHQGRF